MWIAIHIQTDIFYLVGVLSQYCANIGLIYCNLVIQIFQYLAGIFELGISFRYEKTDKLVRYLDLDWARLKDR